MTRLVRSETERTTAATDAVLACVCLAEGWRLLSLPGATAGSRLVWLCVLVLMAVASGLGALVHGLDLTERTRSRLWKPLYLSLGLAVALVVVAAAGDRYGMVVGRRLMPWALLLGVAFYAATLFKGATFVVFIVYEGIAILGALILYGALAVHGSPGAARVAGGLVITLIAAGVQRTSWRVRLGWTFDHNGLFHILQILGVLLIGSGVRLRLLQ